MKIVISIATLLHSGAERVVANLANSLSREGHEIELLLFYDKPVWYSIDKNVKITIDESFIGKKGALAHARFRRKYIKKAKPDAFVSFLAPFNMVNIIACLGVKTPLIVADRSDPRFVPKQNPVRVIRNFLYRFTDGVVLQSEGNRNYFNNSIRKKSEIIFNPVDVGEYAGKAETTEKDKKIVCVGRIINQKNPQMLIDAFSRIADKFPQHKLVFYGDGEMIPELKAMAEEKSIGNRVVFPGAVTDVFESICNSELFVLPSDYEGMPNALLEAMCIGLPVISTRVSGACDLIKNGENGILIDTRDTDALTEAMDKMLSDREFAENCGKNAALVASLLNTEKITSQWLSLIKSVCEKE